MTHASARDRILARIRSANEARPGVDHPGPFEGQRPGGAEGVGFREAFEAAGGEVVSVASLDDAASWLSRFAQGFDTVTVGRGVPEGVAPELTRAEPDTADFAVSMARGAIAETGSLVLDARDGRRTQLLAPTHVVVVEETTIHATLLEALEAVRGDLPSAIGLHSGPSKSADIGQVMVRGVHGPGRVVALVVTSTHVEPDLGRGGSPGTPSSPSDRSRDP